MNIQLIVSVIAISFAFVDRSYASVSRAQMEHLSKGVRKTCASKVHADMALVEGIRNGQFPEGNTPVKCYIKCVMILMKTVRNNKADLNALTKQIKAMASDDLADHLISSVTACYSETPFIADPCEYAWRYTICTYNKDPVNFFFP